MTFKAKSEKVFLTAKIKLLLSPEQEKFLWELADSARQIYNLALEQRRMLYQNFRKSISYNEQSEQLTVIRKEYFSNLHSQTAQSAVKDLDEAYKSYFNHYKTDKTVKPPRFRGYKYFYTLTYPQASFHLEDNAIILHNPKNWLKIHFAEGYRDIHRVKKIKQVEISHENGTCYACITCEVIPERQVTTGKEIAFDPGSIVLLTGYDGEQILEVESKALKKTGKHYDHSLDSIKSKLDQSKTGSKRQRRLMQAKQRTLKKRARRMKQINHSISKELINMGYDAYYVGDWSKKETLADTGIPVVDKKINRVVQNELPVSKLVDYLKYKAELKSKQVAKVNEARSTNTCNECGHVGKKLPVTIRTFRCEKCGLKLNRDENAAINLYRWYAAPVTGPAPMKSRVSIKFVFGHHNKCLIRTSA